MSPARSAGLVYLFLIVTGIFSLAYAPGQYFVRGDAAATFAKLSANAPLFKAAIIAEMACYVSFVALAALLHRLLRDWGETLALLLLGLVWASVPIAFLAIAEKMAVLELLAKGPGQAEAIMAHLRRYAQVINVAEIFWGLWLAPYGWLALRSRVLPTLIGAALILGCFGYLAGVIAPLFWPGYSASIVADIAGAPASFGEIGSAFWLAILGAGKAKGPQIQRPPPMLNQS